MELSHTLLHWKYEQDNEGIAWLTFDRQDASTNTLNTETLREFDSVLEHVRVEKKTKGLVIQSAKKNGWIAGADIQQFQMFENSEAAFELIREGQMIFQKLNDLPFPTVALIHGFCLGGGLELALACCYRITDDSDQTKLGLPEVLLGIHPGWGGTVRLPRMIGVLAGMELILSGRSVSGSTAQKMGFVDLVVPKRHFKTAARSLIERKPSIKKAAGIQGILNWDRIRPLLANILRKKLSLHVNRMHYPAGFAVINNFAKHGLSESAYVAEAQSLAQLIVSENAQNLVRVFFLKEKLKSLAHHPQNKPQHVHIIGAGVMGGDIAAWCALKGMQVTLQDSNLQAIAHALKRADSIFERHLKKHHSIQAAQDRLHPDQEGRGASHADIVLEAIIEDKAAKQALFLELEKIIKPDAILATNTSTFSIEALSHSLKDPTRLIGIHFFNPVAKMSLVEVVQGKESRPECIEQAMAFIRFLDKLPLPVKTAPGFLVNRLLLPYLMESMRILEEGVPAERIDKIAEEFGMPIGPIELADTVGLDVCLYAVSSLKEQLSERFKDPIPEQVQRLVEQKHLGKKTGQGFYRYRKNKPIKASIKSNHRMPDDVWDRLLFRMLNEAMLCLREQIVGDADGVDAGMVFGAGFAPFRGGPIHYAKQQGVELLLQRLKLLEARYGARFKADLGWDMIKPAVAL